MKSLARLILLLLPLFAILQINSYGALAIYSYRGATSTIGGNQTVSTTETGTLAIDLESMNATYVGQFSLGQGKAMQNFWLSAAFENAINTQVRGAKGGTFTVMATAKTPGSRFKNSVVHFRGASGVNSLQTLRSKGQTETAMLPATMSAPGFVVAGNGADDYLSQSSGTFTFNRTATLAANNSNSSFSTVVKNLENGFAARNLIRWPSDYLPGMPAPLPEPPGKEMILVAGGILGESSYLYGTEVADFRIAKYEVTWALWQEVAKWAVANGYDLRGIGKGSGPNHPVRDVNWFDAVKWCNALSEKEGLQPVYTLNGAVYKKGETDRFTRSLVRMESAASGYRLPTEPEAQWAARGGVNSGNFAYAGSNNLDEVAWYYVNSIGAAVNLTAQFGKIASGRGTWPVGLKKANELGLHDIAGNVWEWSWEEYEYDFPPSRLAYFRCKYGGGFFDPDMHVDLSNTSYSGPADLRDPISGFRLARNAP